MKIGFRYLSIQIISLILLAEVSVLADSDPIEHSVSNANAPATVIAEEPSVHSLPRDQSDQPLVHRNQEPPIEGIKLERRQGVSWMGGGLMALMIVLGLIGLCAWGLRRLISPGPLGRSSGIQILNRTYLSSKQSLAVVKLGQRVLLIGITSEQISPLATLTEAAEVEQLLMNIQPVRSTGTGFLKAIEKESALFKLAESSGPELESEQSRMVRTTRQSVRDLLDKMKHLTQAG